jgi:hypothetical protein
MSQRRLIDAGVLGGLVLAVLIVIALDRLLPTQAAPVVVAQPTPSKAPSQARALRLAVTPSRVDENGTWDDMAKLLTTLGKGYQFTTVTEAQLLDPKRFESFDVLFLTCAPGGTEPALVSNLSTFVSKGGTLYASDWRYDCIAATFPSFVAERLRHEGTAQSVQARVVDPGLRDLLGPTVPLRFDLDRWKPAAFGGPRVKVLLEGTYERQGGKGTATAPLLVKFSFGEGAVIFTSFHNEKQNSAVEQQLLKYLVFSAVTAQIEHEVNQTLIKGGFAPRKQNLLSASESNRTLSYSYRATKAGKIRVVLGFEDRGATLKLAVTTPDGKTIEKEGTSTLHIEAPSTGPAEWRYAVTAVNLPFPEFPFTVTVAESD